MALDMKQIQAGFESFLDSKVSRLDMKQKMLIAGATCVLPCIAFFFLAYSPKSTEITTLEAKKSGIESEIQRVEKIASDLNKHKAEMAEVQRQFAEASLLLPDQKEIPSLLTTISGQATSSGLDVLSFKPLPEKPQQFYAEIPVDIAVQGPYHNVGVFLDRISKLPRVVAVNNIQMDSPKQMGAEMSLKSTFQLVTYRFLDPAEIEANTGKNTPGKK
ncbi:type 4a pilus biogenesis protein PilO [Thiovibrio frasassiensis]|uniref:Type 4a pilus biogenesis protein PilO n=1 Tax=Thiovibrio frasassiensis TaxID=2984131 RepID=A0A9X4RPK6_9BACT|nr:type 4a pilus biogenesis protein PilO [Thiovibrio frasassiensis]MDG4475357.1 type 4a pilus biogenesis protein PilO [Thiovibrio frasassiensis]